MSRRASTGPIPLWKVPGQKTHLFMNRSADSFAGTPDGAFIAACKTVCNPSLAPPPIAHTIGHANHSLHSYHCTNHPHGKKDHSTHTHRAADSFARSWGRTVIQTANRRRGQRPRPSHDHTQTLDAQAYTGSDLLTPSSAMQGRTLLIGTHSMCSAGVGDPPRKPRSVAEIGKQTEREPMMSSGAPHNVKQQAPGIGASPANSEQWRCSVEVA